MRAFDERGRTALIVRILHWSPFRKRYGPEEYVELIRLLGSETRALVKRPTYVLGGVVSVGVSVYFLVLGFGGASIDGEAVLIGSLVLLGFTCGINSTREHLCERLLRLKQHPEEVERI